MKLFTNKGGHLRRTPEGIQALKDELQRMAETPMKFTKIINDDGSDTGYVLPDHARIERMDIIMEALRPTDNPNTQGVKFDDGKIRYDLLPPEGPKAVATILAVGAKKYAARNWEQGMDWSRPFAAMQRHLWAWWAGEKNDPDTGLSHLWHAACNCFFLIAYEARGKGTDDRPTS